MEWHRNSWAVAVFLVSAVVTSRAQEITDKTRFELSSEQLFDRALSAESDAETWKLLEPRLPKGEADRFFGLSRYLLALRSEGVMPEQKIRAKGYALQALHSGIDNAALIIDFASFEASMPVSDREDLSSLIIGKLARISQTGSPLVPLQMMLSQNFQRARNGYWGIDFFVASYSEDALLAGSAIANGFVLLDPETPIETKQRACKRLSGRSIFPAIGACREFGEGKKADVDTTVEAMRRYTVRAQTLWANRLPGALSVLCSQGNQDTETELQCNDAVSTAAAFCLVFDERSRLQTGMRQNVCNLNDLRMIGKAVVELVVK